MKTKIFIDLDDTLFDTRSLKSENFRLFESIPGNAGKLSIAEFDELLAQDYKSRPGGVFTPSRMIELLVEKGYSTNGFAEKREKMMIEAKKFFKTEIYRWIIENFPKEKYEYIMYSYGDPNFQHQKLTACGIESQFDQIIYIQSDKAEGLQQYLVGDEDFVLVEDKAGILEKVKSLHPGAKLYHIDGSSIKEFE